MISKYNKKRQLRWYVLLFILFSMGNLGGTVTRAQNSDPLLGLKLPNTTIESVETVAAGAFKPPTPIPIPGLDPYKSLPAFRRVIGVIKPTSDSNIKFEVWLPVENWNGKFFGVGNGGFAGSINYGDMAAPISRGYAVASTDTGHTENDLAKWAVGHPERVIDFGYRAIHEMTLKAKAIIKANYGKAPKFSYFVNCSNGGRQALMEAQRYPEDYDGIIAGAPANNWTHLMARGAFIGQVTLSDPASYIPASKMKTLEDAVLSSCDGVDGLKDGVIDDPRQCRFDPSVLLCKGDESDGCFTAPQVEALKKIYAGPRDAKGKQIYPGLLAGSESGLLGWNFWLFGPAPGKGAISGMANEFYKNLVFEDQNWDVKSLNIQEAMKLADQKVGRIFNATDPNLRAFKKRGGKLIIYHGWNDVALPADNSISYYQSVVDKMGQQNVETFLRFYMVPGLKHCFGGPGPNDIGQFLLCRACDVKRDINMTLEQWVEKGIAPDTIIATKYKNDLGGTDIVRTRPLCRYPKVARYKGTGNIDEAANFACVNPK